MGRIYFINLEGKHYGCKFCTTPLALAEDLISQDDHWGKKCFFMKNVVNVAVGEKQMMPPGLPISSVEIFCVCCSSWLGWKYFQENRMDRGGQFFLDRSKLSLPEGTFIAPEPQQDVEISERIA